MNLPLYIESYPEDLQGEVNEAARAVLASPPVPAGEPELPLFEPLPELMELPEMSVRVLGVAGKPRSGKDVFAEYMLSRYKGVERLNFSDPIIQEVNDWLAQYERMITPANKSHPLHRRLLQVWGRARREEYEDYWVRSLREAISASPAELVIVCGVRAPSDLELIEELEGVCLRVERPGNPYQAEDPIEAALSGCEDRMSTLTNPSEDDLDPYVQNIEALLEELSAPEGPRAGY